MTELDAQFKALNDRLTAKDAEIAELVAEVDALQRRTLQQSAVEVELREENARLRGAMGEMRLVLESQDLRLKKFHDDNARLRVAISAECDTHTVKARKRFAKGTRSDRDCFCRICRIAREGR